MADMRTNQDKAGSKLCLFSMMVSCLRYSSTLKMEAKCPSETPFYLHWATRYVPKDVTLQMLKLFPKFQAAAVRFLCSPLDLSSSKLNPSAATKLCNPTLIQKI
jgi:hypothetical protein